MTPDLDVVGGGAAAAIEVSSPIVITVPHAGRTYPPSLLRQSRLTPGQLRQLEDRHADLLVQSARGQRHQVLIAETARAWLDLNRDPTELDAAMIERRVEPGAGLGAGGRILPIALPGSKVRSGLGLIPRRVPGAGDIYRERLTMAAVIDRIETVHRPWHDAVNQALIQARAAYGMAILIDVHSMPTIRVGQPGYGNQIVIGNRFGRSCHPVLTDVARRFWIGRGWKYGENQPYSGAYTLDRHGRPDDGIHAVQIEVDRALYLGPAGDPVADRVAILADLIAELARQLAVAIESVPMQQAAE
jgi:N-formylglutamate amidohydrolase